MSWQPRLALYHMPGMEKGETISHTWGWDADEERPLTLTLNGRRTEPENEEWEAGCDLTRQQAEALHRWLGFVLAMPPEAP